MMEDPVDEQQPLEPSIAFRRLTVADLPLVHRWLNEDHVRKWWYLEDTPPEGVAAEYVPLIEGKTPTEPYLMLYGGVPIGYIQLALLRDEPDYARKVGLGDDAAAIDVFIGEPTYVYRGLGPGLLVSFLRQYVFSHPEITRCLVDPMVSNSRAIRAYTKVGFSYWRTIEMPGEPEPEHLMTIKSGRLLAGRAKRSRLTATHGSPARQRTSQHR
jgi:aminoglycoside 6'-N-acetyltransferase